MSDWKRINRTDRKKNAAYMRSYTPLTIGGDWGLKFVDNVLQSNWLFSGVRPKRKHNKKTL